MNYAKTAVVLGTFTLLSGCAGLDFGDQGLSYYEPKPYLFVTVNKECVSTATLISLPGQQKFVKFKSGYGSADLSVALSNGILTNAGQKTDTKVPETLTAIATLGTAISTMTEKGAKPVGCTPSALLYAVTNGEPAKSPTAVFPVTPETGGATTR